MTISRRLGLANYPHFGAGTGTTPAYNKIITWGMVLSNNNNTITYNIETNLQPNITLNYEFVGAVSENFIADGNTGEITLDGNSAGVIVRTLDTDYDSANVTPTPVNLTLLSPVNDAVVAVAPDLTITPATPLVATGGVKTTVTGGPENLGANYTLHTITVDDTFEITQFGSNANLNLYVVAVGGGAAGRQGYHDFYTGGGGGAGAVISANVAVNTGIGDPGASSWPVVIGGGGNVVTDTGHAVIEYISYPGAETTIGNISAPGGSVGSISGIPEQRAGTSGNGLLGGINSGTRGGGGGGAGTPGADATLTESGTGGGGIQEFIWATTDSFGGGGSGGRTGTDLPSGGIGGGGGYQIFGSWVSVNGQDGKGGGGAGGKLTTVNEYTPPGFGGDGAVYIRYPSQYRTLSI